MSIPKMANAVGYTDDDLIAGAMEYKRTKKNGLRKLAALAACLCLILVGVWMVLSRSGSGEKAQNVQEPITESNDHRINLEEIKGNHLFALYEKGYKSVKALLEDTDLIVQATPIAVETESEVAVCWVLRVSRSNEKEVEYIRLRQLKDEYLLNVGQEVVLALGQDGDEGYYHIPGGGCGLFRINEATKTVSGQLIESLREQAPYGHSAETSTKWTLDDVFDILMELYAS